MWSVAYAQAAGTAPQQSMLEMMIPFVAMFVIMYFLIIRPQAKRQKEHQNFLNELKRGDEVVTTSGILGRIEGINETFVTVEIADGVRVKMLRSQIASSQKAAEGKTTGHVTVVISILNGVQELALSTTI